MGDGRAEYALQVLKKWRGEKLVSVGLWTRQAEDRLAPFGARSEASRLSPFEASVQMPDASLDLVYIDPLAAGELNQIVEAWLPKVKPGGIIAGYRYVDSAEGDLAVKSFVDSFFAARGMPVHTTDGPSAVEVYPSWIVEVPSGTKTA